MIPIKILYATETGTSFKYANKLSQKLNTEHILLCFSEYELKNESEILILITSTYFDGKPPSNGKSLYYTIEDLKNDHRIERTHFNNILCTCFGLGSKAYEQDFNIVARNLSKWMKELGAKSFYKCGYGNEYDEMEFYFDKWANGLVQKIENMMDEKNNADFEMIASENYSDSDNNDEKVDENTSQVADIEDLNNKMLNKTLSKNLEKQGYGLVGSHSAVKLCRWTKSMIRGHGGCYKHTFYGIQSLSCMEITPSLACANKCVFCWRHYTNPVSKSWKWQIDEPDMIYNELVKKHMAFIKQMKNAPGVTEEFYNDALVIKHCALSLVGEPIMYPRINELIDILHQNKISTFLVTNAQFPEQLRKLRNVTQLYLSIDASNKGDLKEIDRPLHKDFWERFIECIDIIRDRKERTVFRLTVVKDKNMNEFEGYKKLITRGLPDFVEVKGVTFCGYKNKEEMSMKNVPFHDEVVEFCKNILIEGYEIACVHEHSCCVLIANIKFKMNGKWMTWINYDKFFTVRDHSDFSAEKYWKETTYWSIFGSEEKGFNPSLKKKIRNKINKKI